MITNPERKKKKKKKKKKYIYIYIYIYYIYIIYIYIYIYIYSIYISRKHAYIILTPLKPYFYIVKLGFTGVYLIFLILLKLIDCGYSLEPPCPSRKHAYIILTPLKTPLLYSKTGVYRGIHYFSYFCSET